MASNIITGSSGNMVTGRAQRVMRPRRRRLHAAAALATAAGTAISIFGPAAQANSADNVINGSADLTKGASYSSGTWATSSDVDFSSGTTYSPTAFTLNTNAFNLSIGTLDDLDTTQTLTVDNTNGSGTSTITLNGGTNSLSGTAGDLLYVAAGGTLSIGTASTGSLNLALGASGSFDIAGTANIGSNISGTGGFTKTGTGFLALLGSNTYTGATALSAGTLILEANASNTNASGVTSALSNSSALTLYGNTTLEFLGNTTNTIFSPSTLVESGNGPFNFYVGNNGSGTGNTLILANVGQFGAGATYPVFNLSGANGYTLQLGSGSAGTGTLNVENNTTFNSNTAGVTLSIPGGITINFGSTYTLAFGGAGNVGLGKLVEDGTNTINVAANGQGTLSITGASATGTGVLTLSGTLQVGNGTTGSFTTATPLTFGDTGTINFDEAASSSQSMGALTASAGDGTVQSTFVGTSATVNFSSLGTRSTGATLNFVTSGGSNGSTNTINLTGTSAGFISQGDFFGGSNYAYMNTAGGYVRGINYGSDSGAVTAAGGTSTIASSTTSNVELTGNVSNQVTATSVGTLNMQGNTLSLAGTFQTNGILESGSSAATISGGTSLSTTTSGGELVIRTNLATDSLNISTPIINNSTSSLTKSGLGTLTLSGTGNTYAGTTTVDGGTLNLNGTFTGNGATAINAGTLNVSGTLGTAMGTISVGVANGTNNAILNILPGASIGLNNVNMLVGPGPTVGAGQGFVYQSGGAVSGINQLILGANTGGLGSSYGYYNLSAGTLSLKELDTGGFDAGDVGVFDMSGGTMNVANWLIAARGGTGGTGIINLTGGILNYSGGNGFVLNWGGGNQTSIVNIANASLISANGTTLNTMSDGVSTNLGEVNLLSGGLLQVQGIAPGSATGTSDVDFNGGTLKAYTANSTFLTTSVTAANVYSGGGTIDNNGVAITIPIALSAPAGSGVSANPTVISGGSGYLGAPAVTFTGGGGVGASGYATINPATGQVTGIVITDPGTGYTSPPTITLTGGGGSTAIIGPISIAANVSGAMTFQGSNTTSLTAASTYTGGTTILAGTLAVGVNNALSSAGTVNVNGGTLGLSTFSDTVGGVTLTSGSITGTSGVLSGSSYNLQSGTVSAILGGSGSALTKTTSGSVALSSVSTYTGATTVSGGTLTVGGSGSINSSSGITINGSGAKFVQTSSVTSTPAITLTQGTLDGTGAVGAVAVGAGTGGIVTNGNGTSSQLTAGSLTFNGAGTLSVNVGGGSTTFAGIVDSGALGTANTGSGEITVNVNPTNIWAVGTTVYNLVSFSGATGTLSDFTKGTIGLLTSRESATLGLTSNDLTLTIAADAPTWTGKDNSNWQVGSTGSNHNWQLIVAGTPTDYISGDTVVFDDSAMGESTLGAVNISAANVSPTATTFNNSAFNYTVSSTGGYGIAGSGSLTKTGTASLAINTTNSYTGVTTISGGTLSLTGTLGSGGGTAITNSATFTESSTGVITGSSSITNSSGTTTLAGSNSYTGVTTINGGALSIQNNSALGTGSGTSTSGVTVASGAALQMQGNISTTTAVGLTLNGTGVTASPNGALENVSGSNTFSGLIALGSNATIGSDAGTLAITNAGTISGSGFGLTLAGSGNGSIASIIGTGTGTVTMNGGGTWTLSGASTFTGGTTISSGTLSIAANANLGSTTVGQAPVTLNGGTLITTAGITNTHAFTIGASGGTIDVTTTGQYFFNTANTLLGSGTLTVTGNGTLTANTGNLRLAQTNTFSGNVILQSGGILEYGAASAIGSAGTITINNQGEVAVNAGVTLPNAITVNGGTNSVLSFENGTTGIFSGNVTLNTNATVGLRDWYNYGASTSGTFSGVISGGGYGITTNPGTSAGGVVALTNANTYTGATVISAGTSVQLGGGSTTGSISTSSAITDNGTLIINRSNAVAQGTDFSGAALTGSGGFTQAGTGTTTLSAANIYTGNTVVNGGELSVTGGSIGNTTQILIGNNGSGVGAAMYQSGGTVTNTSAVGGGFQIGSSVGAAGYYNLSSGTINVGGEIDPGGLNGGAGTFGEFDMSGGIVNLPAIVGTYFLPNRGAAGEVSVVNISSGTVQISAGTAETNNTINGLTANWGAGTQTATITISGTGQFLTPSLTTKLNAAANSTNVAYLNLDGGTLQTLGFGTAVGNTTDNTNAVINFNGGTLKAGNATNSTFMASLGAAYVYSGNGTIDNNGQSITIAQPLLTPTGSGVSSVTVGTAGSGYVVPPQVTFTGGTGSGATGYATISPTTGAVTGIVVTNPGNYSAAPTGITLTGNVASGGTAASSFTINSTTNVSGGMTFQGVGTTTLSGANTYSGGTTLNAGTLTIGSGGTLGATTGSLTVSNLNSGAGTAVVLNLPTAAAITTGFLSGTVASPSSGTNSATINTQSGEAFTVNQTTAGSYAGVIAGSGSFALGSLSSNALVLSGANTYTGGTTINAGTLRVNNTSGSGTGTGTVTVQNGGRLGGSGSIGTSGTSNGAITVNNGGLIAAGASSSSTDTGTLTSLSTSGVTLNAGSGYDWKIQNASGTPGGTGWDKIATKGLTFASSGSPLTSSSPFTVYIQGNPTNLVPGSTSFVIATDPAGNIPIDGTTYSTAGGPVALTGASTPSALANLFVLSTAGFSDSNSPAVSGSSSFTLELVADGASGQDLALGYSATPEPGTAMLVLAGVVPMLAARRRRRKAGGNAG